MNETSRPAPTGEPEKADRLPVLPPWQALAELAVLTALIVGIDRALPAVDLADMHPNPFWFPILLLSLQYGTVSGVLAAGVAVAVTMLSGIPEQDVGEHHFAYFVRVWAQPILWIAAAVFFGQFRMRQIANKRELQRSVIELSGQRSALAEYATNLRMRCDSLEKTLAAQPAAPAHALLDALARLQQGDDALESGLERMVGVLAPGAAASVFVVRDGHLLRVASTGWPSNARWRTDFTPSDLLYAGVVERGMTLSVTEIGDELKLAGEGLAAIPILSSDGRRSLGMLKIEQAEPSLVDHALAPRLHALAAVLAPVLERREPSAGRALGPASAQLSPAPTRQPRRLLRWLPAGRTTAAPGRQAGTTDGPAKLPTVS